MHFRDMLCVIMLDSVEISRTVVDILILQVFLHFSCKMNKFIRWTHLIWHNFVKVRDN